MIQQHRCGMGRKLALLGVFAVLLALLVFSLRAASATPLIMAVVILTTLVGILVTLSFVVYVVVVLGQTIVKRDFMSTAGILMIIAGFLAPSLLLIVASSFPYTEHAVATVLTNKV